ncbi:MAG: ABC transporter ATP-binding protein [Polyangiales bacterium]
MTQPIYLRGFTRRYGEHTIIRDLDIELVPGELVALVGRSGSGKTTLLRALAGLEPVEIGTLQLPSSRSVVFQDARLLPWKRVWRNVALGVRTGHVRERAEAALREVGLGHRLDAWPLTLSGGESQRAALARALVREPQLLLLDEPFAALDALTRIKMHALVLQLWRAHRPAVVLVTHDVSEAVALADRVLVLEQGQIIAELQIEGSRPRDPVYAERLQNTLFRHLGVDVREPASDAPADDPPSGNAEPNHHSGAVPVP